MRYFGESVHYFCCIDSNGELGSTNLQLHSLGRAADEWTRLVECHACGELIEDNLEVAVFFLSCLGLSLSQLLGQNSTSISGTKISSPGKLLAKFLDRVAVDRLRKKRLLKAFDSFNELYGAIRHFGPSEGDRKYKLLAALSWEELDLYRRMTIEIWDIAISHHRSNGATEIEDFTSITEVIKFERLLRDTPGAHDS